MKKYAPKKVFIWDNGKYIEITYAELCRREEIDPSYKDKLFLPLYGMLMEVSKSTYLEFYRLQRRQKCIGALDTVTMKSIDRAIVSSFGIGYMEVNSND